MFEAYDRVFDMFYKEYITSEIEHKYNVAVLEDYEPLSSVVDPEVSAALEDWEASCRRKTGKPFKCDDDKWNKFVITAALKHSPITPKFLDFWLKVCCLWDDEFFSVIVYYCHIYDYSRKILQQYNEVVESNLVMSQKPVQE